MCVGLLVVAFFFREQVWIVQQEQISILVCVCVFACLSLCYISLVFSLSARSLWMDDDDAVYSMTGRRFVSLCSSLSILCVCEFCTKARNGPTIIIGEERRGACFWNVVFSLVSQQTNNK